MLLLGPSGRETASQRFEERVENDERVMADVEEDAVSEESGSKVCE